MGIKWSNDFENLTKIPLKKMKKSICKAEGYEKDMLALLYGAVGMFSFDEERDFIDFGKIKLLDVSRTTFAGDDESSFGSGSELSNLEQDYFEDNIQKVEQRKGSHEVPRKESKRQK